jgi:ribosome-binding factor A
MALDPQTNHHPVGHRSERLAEEIRHEVTLMLAGELKDPRLAVPLTVTEVRLTPDMRTVRVFVRLEATDEERAAVMKGLKAAAKFVRHELIDRLHLRRAPEVIFMEDQSEEYGNRIDALLQKVTDPKKP